MHIICCTRLHERSNNLMKYREVFGGNLPKLQRKYLIKNRDVL